MLCLRENPQIFKNIAKNGLEWTWRTLSTNPKSLEFIEFVIKKEIHKDLWNFVFPPLGSIKILSEVENTKYVAKININNIFLCYILQEKMVNVDCLVKLAYPLYKMQILKLFSEIYDQKCI